MFPQIRQTLTHHQHLTLNNQHPTLNNQQPSPNTHLTNMFPQMRQTLTHHQQRTLNNQHPFNQHVPSDAPNFNTLSTTKTHTQHLI